MSLYFRTCLGALCKALGSWLTRIRTYACPCKIYLLVSNDSEFFYWEMTRMIITVLLL